MRLETFFEKFEWLAEAPNGVEKLRRLVLRLAVQGHLVTQKAQDGDARSIFGAGAARSTDAAEVDPRYPVPISWCWVRFAVVGEQRLGKMLDKRGNRGELKPYLRNTNVQWMRFELEDIKELRLEPDELAEYRLRSGDLLICEGGEPGRCAIWRDTDREMYFQKALHRVRPRKGILPEYLAICLRIDAQNGVLERAFTGATIKHFTGRSLSQYLIPIPPLAEQKRIVARVDELMALCDRLEVQHQEREARHATLAQASLARFGGAPTPPNLEFLFHDSYAIEPADLRRCLTELAIQGRLLPQQAADEPVAVAGSPAEDESPPGASPPFHMPASWRWIRIAALRPDFQNGISSRGDGHGSPVVVIRLADVTSQRLSLQGTREIPIDPSQIPKYVLRQGDVLITRVNGSADLVGTFVPVQVDLPVIYCDHFIRMRIDSKLVDSEFLTLVGSSRLVRDQIAGLFVSTAGQKTVNQGHIRSLFFPLPPLPEQRRIVSKVTELMSHVARLDAQIIASRAVGVRLAEALVAELTGRN